MQKFNVSGGIPVYLTSTKEEAEGISDPISYLITGKGVVRKNKNKFYTSYKSVEGIPSLPEIDSSVSFSCEKMKAEMFRTIRQFFADIYEKYKTEVVIILYYSFDRKDWLWVIPEQEVSAASAPYDMETNKVVSSSGKLMDDIPKDFTKLGSIHSHAAMGASHSGVDDKDEYQFDGLHITIGSFNQAECTYSCRWMIDANAITTKVVDVVTPFTEPVDYPKEIHELVTKHEPKHIVTHSWNTHNNHKMSNHYKGGYYDHDDHSAWEDMMGGNGTTSNTKKKISRNLVHASEVGIKLY